MFMKENSELICSDEEIEENENCFLKWSKSFKNATKENCSANIPEFTFSQIDSSLYEEISFGKDYSLKLPIISAENSQH